MIVLVSFSPNELLPTTYTLTDPRLCCVQFSGTYQFHCEADFAGHPESCSVLDSSGKTLSDGYSDDSSFSPSPFLVDMLANEDRDLGTSFVGFAIGQDGYCGGSWVLESEFDRCDPDSTGFTVS